jgi:hypothetical protein
MNKKQPKQTDQTIRKLKDAFWSLYKEKNIDKITVKDITTKAGFNRSTFYAYFTDVYDVLDQIESDLIPGPEVVPPPNHENVEDDLIQGFISLYETKSEYYSVLLSENGDPKFSYKLKEVFKTMMQCNLEGKINLSSNEIDYALEYIVSANIAIIKYWFEQKKSIPIERLVPLIYNLMENKLVNNLIEKE